MPAGMSLARRSGRRRQADEIRLELAQIDREADALELITSSTSVGGVSAARRFEAELRALGPVEARFVRLGRLDQLGSRAHLDELEVWSSGPEPRNLAASEAGGNLPPPRSWVTTSTGRHLNDGRYGNGRSWISRERGKGWAQVGVKSIAKIDRVVEAVRP